MSASLLEVASRQWAVFSRRQALDSGLTRHEIQSRLTRGEWGAVYPGVFRIQGTPATFEQASMAAVLAGGEGAVLSHRGAGTLHRLPNLARSPEITVPRGNGASAQGLIIHRSRILTPGDVSEYRGIPVTSVARTLFDLAAAPYLDSRQTQKLVDHCLVRRMCRRGDLEACLARFDGSGRRGMARFGEILDGLAPGARPMGSDFEAELFRGLIAARVPFPESQVKVVLPDGSVIFLDFAWPELRLALEADSYLWHATREAWRRDRARNNEAIALGWSIIPVTWDMILFHMQDTLRLIGAAHAVRMAA